MGQHSGEVTDAPDVTLVFETDKGDIRTIHVCQYQEPPVWQGMHATIYMDHCRFVSVTHLPPDAGK